MPVSHKSSLRMNLFPSEWLLRILSIRDFDELYFLCAFWLNWKLVVPCWALIDLSMGALELEEEPFSGTGAKPPAPLAFFCFSCASIFLIVSLSSEKSVPSRVLRVGTQMENLALNYLYIVSLLKTGLHGFFIRFKCSSMGHFSYNASKTCDSLLS